MLRILFVCHGNTCRSPMAEAVAPLLLNIPVDSESAGTHPSLSGRAAPNAQALIKERYGLDLSHHRPRSVFDLPLDAYDWIITLDHDVYTTLTANTPTRLAHILEWDIEDPYGTAMPPYERALADIERELRALAARLNPAG